MTDIIKEIQGEINLLMVSKYAKFSDKQINSWGLCSDIGKSNVGKRNAPSREVEQYTLDGTLMNTHESLSQAAKSINRSNKSVREAISGKSKTCGGFIWKYKN